MSNEYSGWPRDRQRNEDRDWQRRNDDYRREDRWRSGGRDEDRGRYGREDYGRRDWDRDDRRDWTGSSGGGRNLSGNGWREGGYPTGSRGRYGRGDRSWDYYGPRDYGQTGLGSWGFDERYLDPGQDYGWSRGYGRDYGERNARRDWYDQDRDTYRGYGERRSPYGERGWWDRASDEVSSWFGDEEADQRRREDRRRDEYRGRGPRGYTRSDERIREDVSDRLTDNPILDASDIEVATQSGEVTLNGHVDSRYSKRLAEDIAEDVSGVRHVQNNLRIRENRDSISGTYSGISEGGATSDLGRISSSGIRGSSGTGSTAGTMTGTTSGDTSGNATTGTTTNRTTR